MLFIHLTESAENSSLSIANLSCEKTLNMNSKEAPFSKNTFITILPMPISNHQNDSEVVISSEEDHATKNPSPSHNQAFSNILQTFFKLAYIICFSPFQIVERPKGHFYTKQWWPQQIICAIGTFSSVFYRVIELHMELPNENVEWNPALYFKLFHKFLNLIFNLNIWISMWCICMRHKFVAIVQFFYTKMNHQSLQTLQKNISRVVLVVGIINTISVAIYFVFGTDILPQSAWSPVFLFKCFAFHSKTLSFCVERFQCENLEFDKIQFSVTDYILSAVLMITRFLRKVMGISEELLVLVVPLTLWTAVKDFVTHFVNQRTNEDMSIYESWASISKRYADLNELNDLVNRTFGPILLSYTLTALFYFSINLDDFLTAGDALVKFKFLVFYILIISTFTISAEIVRQMGKLVPWISNNLNYSLSGMSHKELTVILHEISSNRIGISACGLFTVTYSVVAQMTGVFITYFIIMVQYRENK